MRDRLGGVARWLADNRVILVALGLAALLGRFLFDWTPDARPPRPMPSPTAAATPIPLAIAYPTAAPTATPAGTPTPVAALRGAGQLLYPGILAGRRGVVAVNADGTDRRLVAEGAYQGVAWAPDGRRFIAYGSAGPTPVVDLFTAEGRLLQHLAPPDRKPLSALWAPDSRRVAVLIESYGGPAGRGESARLVWLLDGQGVVELALGKQTYLATFFGGDAWSAAGRLALAVFQDRDGDGRADEVGWPEIWTVDAEGGDARKLAGGEYVSLGWSRDGDAVYVLGDPERDADGRIVAGLTRLIAIDERTGERRTVAAIADVARQLPLQPRADGTLPAPRSFTVFAPAVARDRFALWLLPETDRGEPDAADGPYLVILDRDGRLLRHARAQPLTQPIYSAWSPDGARLAFSYRGLSAAQPGSRQVGGFGMVAVEGAAGPAEPVTVEATSITYGGAEGLRWSPDGRWFAFNRLGNVEVAAAADPARSWPLGLADGWADWRPPPGP